MPSPRMFRYDIEVFIVSDSGECRSFSYRRRLFPDQAAVENWARQQQQDLLQQHPGWKPKDDNGIVVTYLEGQ